MVVQHNLSALFASNQLGQISGQQQKTTEKLSSGYRINRAADDAAGLSISEKMRAQIRGLNRGAENTQDGISFCQVADGALDEVQKMLQRMNELSVQAANGTLSPADRAAINHEMQQIRLEMTRTFDSTDFNTHPIWNADPTARKAIPNTSQNVLNRGYGSSMVVTNKNVGTLPASGKFDITADTKTITFDWIGLDKGVYQATSSYKDFIDTGKFSLNDIKVKNASGTYDLLSDIDSDRLISYSGGYQSFGKLASDEEIIDALENANFSLGYLSVGLSSNNLGANTSVNDFVINVKPTYGSFVSSDDPTKGGDDDKIDGVNYDSYLTSALTAQLADPDNNRTNLAIGSSTAKQQWTFSFELEDYGTITAKPTSFEYWAGTQGTEGIFWNTNSYGGKSSFSRYLYSFNTGSLAEAVGGANGFYTAGVASGTAKLGFTLYDKDGTTAIGSFNIRSYYTPGATKQSSIDSFVQQFTDTLKADTIFTPGTMSMTLQTSPSTYVGSIPEFKSLLGMKIQCSSDPNDEIEIQYESLSVASLGLSGIDVLTQANAKTALGLISNAIDAVSEQRATFGAYQNRLEHTYFNTTNTAENVQAAESRIRDTDMSEEMVRHSMQSILSQAGTTMLSQSQHNADYIMDLLK